MLYYILVGAIAGWLGGKIMRGSGFGILGNILVGIVGGIIGGFAFGVLGIKTESGLLGEIITSLVGAVVLIWVLNQATGKKR